MFLWMSCKLSAHQNIGRQNMLRLIETELKLTLQQCEKKILWQPLKPSHYGLAGRLWEGGSGVQQFELGGVHLSPVKFHNYLSKLSYFNIPLMWCFNMW